MKITIFLDLYFYSDDESTTATEDEDDIRARELRRQEFWLKNPTRSSDTDTGSETEVKISQDSIDNITQESLILPIQTHNFISPQEIDVNNSEVDQDIISTEDIEKSPDKKILTINTLIGNTDQPIVNDVKFDSEENTSQSKASGSLIHLPDSSCNLLSDNRENDTVNLNSSVIVSNPIEQNNSNIHNVDECISEYESLVDESCVLNLDNGQAVQSESSNESDKVISKLTNIDSNELNNEVISVNENLDEIGSISSELSQTIVSSHNEISNKVMPDLDITPETSEAISTSNIKLQTVFAGIMLPDAIPFSQTSYSNTIQPNTEEVLSLKERLPDLITSSPNHSRDSSPSSSYEMYKSTETLYDELLMSDSQDKMTAEDTETCDSESTQNYIKSTDDIPKDNKLKLSIKNPKRIPIVTITSPSPTNEKSLEETSVESAKLTVPNKTNNQAVQPDGNSSFDKLKRDLRQRKARNKMSVGELRPLSTENARRKINKYFTDVRKQKIKDQNTRIQNENSPDIRVVELDIKPKLSAKVETKDIMKYFQKTKQESSEELNYGRPESPKNNNNINNDELNEIDVDAIVKEFEEIERQNEEMSSIDTEDIESKLHLDTLSTKLHLEDTNEQSNVANNVNVAKERELPSNGQNITSNNIAQTEVHKEKQSIIIDHPTNEINSEQTPLPSQQVNNILDAKSYENIIINPSNNAINAEEKILTSPLISDILQSTSHECMATSSHKIQESNTGQAILESNSNTLVSKLDERRKEVTTDLRTEQITPQLNNIFVTEFYEKETNKQFGPKNVQQTMLIPHLNYGILGTKLHEQKMDDATHSASNTKPDVKQIVSTTQFNNINNNKYDIVHRSDNTLNRRKEITNRNDTLYKSSKSSCELTALPVEHEQVTKVKIVEQNIEVPKHVKNMNSNSNTILPNLTDEVPKRPDRKHGHHELSSSIRLDISNAQLTPDVPIRRRSSKQKSNVPPSLEESTCNSTCKSSSATINERLVESDINTNKHNDAINIGTNKLKHSSETANRNSEISKTISTLGNTSDEHKHSQHTKSPPLINSDKRESMKSIPPKNDRTKKDKCIVS